MSELKRENITDEELAGVVAARKAKREAEANQFNIEDIKPGMSREDKARAIAEIAKYYK
jgi:hypothetical protein